MKLIAMSLATALCASNAFALTCSSSTGNVKYVETTVHSGKPCGGAMPRGSSCGGVQLAQYWVVDGKRFDKSAFKFDEFSRVELPGDKTAGAEIIYFSESLTQGGETERLLCKDVRENANSFPHPQ